MKEMRFISFLPSFGLNSQKESKSKKRSGFLSSRHATSKSSLKQRVSVESLEVGARPSDLEKGNRSTSMRLNKAPQKITTGGASKCNPFWGEVRPT